MIFYDTITLEAWAPIRVWAVTHVAAFALGFIAMLTVSLLIGAARQERRLANAKVPR